MAFLINNAIISNQGAAVAGRGKEDLKKIVFTRGLLGSDSFTVKFQLPVILNLADSPDANSNSQS